MTEQSWVAAAAASLYQSYKYQVGAMANGDLCKYQHICQATGIPLPRTLETNKQTKCTIQFRMSFFSAISWGYFVA